MKFINDTLSNTTFTLHWIYWDITRIKFIYDTASKTILSGSILSPWISEKWSSSMILRVTPLLRSIWSGWTSEE